MGTVLSSLSAALAKQVARIDRVPSDLIDAARHEALRHDIPWVEHYREYQSGGWWTASLLNQSGNPADVEIRDGRGRGTSLLADMPSIRTLVESLGVEIMWARLAKLSANSFLWEHVDYVELEERQRFRLHIPLSTNSSARLVIAGRSVNLAVGHVWRLTPVHPHGVCNRYGPDRLHIIIDCYENAALQRLIANADLREDEAPWLPPAEDVEVSRALDEANSLLDLGLRGAAEQAVLRLFFRFTLEPGQAYELLADLYAQKGMSDDSALWRQRRKLFMGKSA